MGTLSYGVIYVLRIYFDCSTIMREQLISAFVLILVFAVNLLSGDLHTVKKREVFNVNKHTLPFKCNGGITLLSNKDETEIEIRSEKLLRILRRSSRKSVKKKIKRIGMRYAKVTGDCCWKICDQYRGGEAKRLMKPHTYHSAWSIRAVKLIKC